MSLRLSVAILGLVLFAVPGFAADPVSLSNDGGLLEPVLVDPASVDLNLPVAVGDDPVDATHVIFQMHSTNALMMRTADGFYVPWDGDQANLANAGFPVEDGIVRFKLFNQDITGASLPLTVVIAYRSGDDLKFGQISVGARP